MSAERAQLPAALPRRGESRLSAGSIAPASPHVAVPSFVPFWPYDDDTPWSPGSAGSSVTSRNSPLALALCAAEHADVCLVGRLASDPEGVSCALEVAAPGSGSLPAGVRPLVVRGTMAYATDTPEGPAGWLPLRRIAGLAEDGTSRDLAELPETERVTVLEQAGLIALELLAAERGDPTGLSAEQRGCIRVAEEEALVPLARACGDLGRTTAPPHDDDLRALRRLQERCRDLYGRLEPERALSWALEELGELSQAMRRGESTVRLEEELGQVLVWALCLANITRTDAAHAFAKGYAGERERQLRKYGTVKPYRRAVLPC
ncbi:MazG nucleotide pyrophosphohydrolase domain-containing protein [Streptomyces sp. NPDC087658]|uniref:MazG nucleotide pyrophosphohydrolase domain-containing protein n=1 Tax=Streptomyces sp. NPDC087658 TaxID=3365800 RepID=UPI00381FEA02